MFCTAIQIGRRSEVMRMATNAVGGMRPNQERGPTSTRIISVSVATSSTAT
jgi:hypothetical protein